MSFKLKIIFTGVCGLIPNKPFKNAPGKVCVVFADGDYSTKGADGKGLNRHRAFIKFKTKNVVGGSRVPESVDGIWYLGKRSFRLQTTGASALKIDNLDGLADLTKVAPDYADADPNAVVGTPPEKLLARFFVEVGTLACGQSQGEWIFPKILSDQHVRVKDLSNEVILLADNLTTLEIVASPINGGDDVRLPLTAPDGEIVELTVANLCDDNPLEWEQKYDAKPDLDFRWHFELLSPAKWQDLVKAIEGLYLPYPYPVPQGNAQGANCFTTAYRDQSF
jgi:hypothetical protein